MTHRRTGRDLRGFVHRGRQLLALSAALLVRALGASRRPYRRRRVGEAREP